MRASHDMDCISCVQRGARSHGLVLISALLYTKKPFCQRLIRFPISRRFSGSLLTAHGSRLTQPFQLKDAVRGHGGFQAELADHLGQRPAQEKIQRPGRNFPILQEHLPQVMVKVQHIK